MPVHIEDDLFFEDTNVTRNPDDAWFIEYLKPYYLYTIDGQYLFGNTQVGRRPDRAFYIIPEGYVEDGEVIILLPIPFEYCADYCPRHAGKGHDIDHSVAPRMGKISGASDAQDRLSLEGIVEVGPCQIQNRFYRWFVKVSEMSLEDLRQAMLVLFLVVIGEEDLQEVGEPLVPQAVSLPHGVDVENPFRNR